MNNNNSRSIFSSRVMLAIWSEGGFKDFFSPRHGNSHARGSSYRAILSLSPFPSRRRRSSTIAGPCSRVTHAVAGDGGRDEWREGVKVVKGAAAPLENSAHGLLRRPIFRLSLSAPHEGVAWGLEIPSRPACIIDARALD